MKRDVFDQMKERPNREFLFPALMTVERLTGKDMEDYPPDVLSFGAVDLPDILRDDERVVFHFGAVPEGSGFRDGNVLVQIFSRHSRDQPACSFCFGRVVHDHGEAFYPVRVKVRAHHSIPESTSDFLFYAQLCQVDERAAAIFSHMWRLERGPVIMGRDGSIVGAVYS